MTKPTPVQGLPRVARVTLVRIPGRNDELHFQLCAPSSFPVGYPESAPDMKLELQKGYAEEWCRFVGLQIDEVLP